MYISMYTYGPCILLDDEQSLAIAVRASDAARSTAHHRPVTPMLLYYLIVNAESRNICAVSVGRQVQQISTKGLAWNVQDGR